MPPPFSLTSQSVTQSLSLRLEAIDTNTRVYRRIQGYTRDYRGIQGCTRVYRGIQGIYRYYYGVRGLHILVPRAYDPSGLRQESRGSGSKHFRHAP